MANVKLVYGGSTETTWNSTGRITTPSLILVDGGTTRYTPIYSGSAGGTITDGNYKSTLGHLIVADKRVALSRYQYKFTDSVTIGHYFTYTIEKKQENISYGYGGAGSSRYYAVITTNIYIIVRGTSIGNGSLKSIYATNGYGTNGSGTTTTSSWYLTLSYEEIQTKGINAASPLPSAASTLNFTLNATFTSSSGTDLTVSKSCVIYNGSEHTDTLSTEVTI